MSPSQYLEQSIVKTVEPTAQRLHWRRVWDDSTTGGASRDYAAENFYIRITCDRGLVEVQVGSSAENLRAVSFYKDLVEPAVAGKWNLSVEESFEFIESHWDWFKEHFTQERMTETLRQLDAVARQHATHR